MHLHITRNKMLDIPIFVHTTDTYCILKLMKLGCTSNM